MYLSHLFNFSRWRELEVNLAVTFDSYFTIISPFANWILKKPALAGWLLRGILVGTRGFEPPTPDTP